MTSNDYIYTSEGLIPTNELKHYGVLGMKWGVHKTKAYEKKAKRSKESAKEWDEIAKEAKKKGNYKAYKKYTQYAKQDRVDIGKYTAKAKKTTAKHTKLAGGKKTYDRVKAQSTGKLFAKSLLYGTYGTLKYEQARTRGASKGKSFVNGMLYGTLNDVTSGWASIIEPRIR